MDRIDLLTFMRAQKWAVQASVSEDGAAQAAAIGVIVTDELEVVFDTFADARKAKNLRANPSVALVVGWDDGQTVQYEGVADEPQGEELARIKALYFAKFPDGVERERQPNITYFRVRPLWIRHSDFRGVEPVVRTFTEFETHPPARPRGCEPSPLPLMRDTYCSYCGSAYPPPLGYPRSCRSCQTQVWANPVPVSVVLVPVLDDGRTGLLVVRRAIEPGRGKLALVGGFLEAHETWAEGGAREIREETRVHVDPSSLTPLWFTSTAPRPDRVLLFSVATPIDGKSLPPYIPDTETSERGLVFGPSGLDESFAFALHAEAARRFFAERGQSGEHSYRQL